MRVSRSKLEVGMKLGADVVDSGGRLLAPAGIVLTRRHIAAFESWDIPSVQITYDDGGPGATLAELPELDKKQEVQIRRRFEHTDLDHPFMMSLLEECLVRARRQRALEPEQSLEGGEQ